jgi:hypothetical protein
LDRFLFLKSLLLARYLILKSLQLARSLILRSLQPEDLPSAHLDFASFFQPIAAFFARPDRIASCCGTSP